MPQIQIIVRSLGFAKRRRDTESHAPHVTTVTGFARRGREAGSSRRAKFERAKFQRQVDTHQAWTRGTDPRRESSLGRNSISGRSSGGEGGEEEIDMHEYLMQLTLNAKDAIVGVVYLVTRTL